MQYKKIISNKDLKILGLLIKKSLKCTFIQIAPQDLLIEDYAYFTRRGLQEKRPDKNLTNSPICAAQNFLFSNRILKPSFCVAKKINLPHICWWEMSHLCPPNKCPYLPSDIFASSHGRWTSPWSATQSLAGSHIPYWTPPRPYVTNTKAFKYKDLN